MSSRTSAWTIPLSGRVLVMSLQRLGDLLTAARVTAQVAATPGVDAVEVLHFEETAAAASLLPGVLATHSIPYRPLARLRRTAPLAAFARLRDRIRQLRGAQGYDTVINLTSTRFAALLAPALAREPQAVRGPSTDGHGHYRSPHPAVEYLNDDGVDRELNVFAHADLYALAAGIRVGNRARLPSDPTVATMVDAFLTAHDIDRPPIVVHVRSSDPAKDWEPCQGLGRFGGVLAQLRRTTDRTVILVGAPSETPSLQALADATGALVAAWPLRETAELIRRSAGVLGVDTVSIHLAAAVGARQVVLRRGQALGHAFLPGPGAITMDDRGAGFEVGDVVAVTRRHLLGTPMPVFVARGLDTRTRVRAVTTDGEGMLGLSIPAWVATTAEEHRNASSDRLWRAAWGDTIRGRNLSASTIAALCDDDTEAGQGRRLRATASDNALGRALAPAWQEAA